MHTRGRRAACAALLALAACVAHAAQDSGYPTRPIRFLVPFPPGGSPDIQARLLADPLRELLGKPLIIDNRAGANGVVAMEIAARAPADGYTMIIGTVGIWTVHPHLHKLTYNVLTDFAPVIHVATTPGVLVVGPTSVVTSVKELIAFGKHNPGKLNYGSAGIGGFGHVCAELFTSMTGGTPQEMDAYLRKELAKYGRLVKEAGIKADSTP